MSVLSIMVSLKLEPIKVKKKQYSKPNQVRCLFRCVYLFLDFQFYLQLKQFVVHIPLSLKKASVKHTIYRTQNHGMSKINQKIHTNNFCVYQPWQAVGKKIASYPFLTCSTSSGVRSSIALTLSKLKTPILQ